jgi:hypothetical protein
MGLNIVFICLAFGLVTVSSHIDMDRFGISIQRKLILKTIIILVNT